MKAGADICCLHFARLVFPVQKNIRVRIKEGKIISSYDGGCSFFNKWLVKAIDPLNDPYKAACG